MSCPLTRGYTHTTLSFTSTTTPSAVGMVTEKGGDLPNSQEWFWGRQENKCTSGGVMGVWASAVLNLLFLPYSWDTLLGQPANIVQPNIVSSTSGHNSFYILQQTCSTSYFQLKMVNLESIYTCTNLVY